ncbi:MAG: Crp/Fnr family transcriptional regulator [Clostridia bacterium]|nr:Crp/Fnr family transcriptional regulator [Clostridia bacterium]
MKTDVLDNLFLWQGLPKEAVRACLATLSKPAVFEKGAIIYGERDFPRAFAVILEGKISVCSHSGARVRTLEAGSVFGVTALFGSARYASTITALSRVKLQFIEEERLEEWMKQYPEVSMNYIRFLHQRILYLNDKIRLYTEGSVEERLIGYIQSHTAPDGEILLPGGLSALAKELNIGRTSLYRTLEQLTEKNEIIKKGTRWYREVER